MPTPISSSRTSSSSASSSSYRRSSIVLGMSSFLARGDLARTPLRVAREVIVNNRSKVGVCVGIHIGLHVP